VHVNRRYQSCSSCSATRLEGRDELESVARHFSEPCLDVGEALLIGEGADSPPVELEGKVAAIFDRRWLRHLVEAVLSPRWSSQVGRSDDAPADDLLENPPHVRIASLSALRPRDISRRAEERVGQPV
jgi:hypothetical protein